MKLKFIYLLVFLTFGVFAQDQVGNIQIEYGAEITEEKGKLISIIGEANGKIYALGLKGKANYFLKIFKSSDMSIISNNKIKLPDVKDKKLTFEDIKLLNGNVYILGSYLDRKAKQYKLEAIQVSEDGELSNNTINLFSSPVAKGSAKGNFYFKDSHDKSKLLVMHVGLYSKEDLIKYNIKLIDDKLNILASHSEKVSYTDKYRYEFDISDFDVNNNDDVFVVTNESHLDKKKNTTFSDVKVYTFKKDNGYKREVFEIDLSGNELINCKMIATHNNKIQLVGFYSELRKSGKSNKKLEGVYNGTIDLNSNSVLPFKFNAFDYETKVKILGERKADKDKDLKPLYRIKNIVEKEDGGIILLSELTYVYYGKSQGIGPLSFTPVTYTNNEIIVSSLSSNGDIEWTNVVAKKQRASSTIVGFSLAGLGGSVGVTVSASVSFPLGVLGKGPEYLGAIPFYKDGKLSVIFNDNIKNKGLTELDDVKYIGNTNKSALTLFEFDSNGNLNRIDSKSDEANLLNIRPQIFFDKTSDEYIIYASKKSVDKLGRLFLK